MIGKKKAKKEQTSEVALRHYDVVRAPVITEKSTMMSEQGKFVFEVAHDATKPEAKAAIEALFGVNVTKINVLNRPGKTKLFRGTPGRQADKKKVIVTLKEGQSIDMSAGVR